MTVAQKGARRPGTTPDGARLSLPRNTTDIAMSARNTNIPRQMECEIDITAHGARRNARA